MNIEYNISQAFKIISCIFSEKISRRCYDKLYSY